MFKVIKNLNELSNSDEQSIDLLHIRGSHEFYNSKGSDLLKFPLNSIAFNDGLDTM